MTNDPHNEKDTNGDQKQQDGYGGCDDVVRLAECNGSEHRDNCQNTEGNTGGDSSGKGAFVVLFPFLKAADNPVIFLSVLPPVLQ